MQGGTIPRPLTDWGGRGFCPRSTMSEAQRPVPGSLSVTGHSPVRVQGGQRLVDRRSGRNSPARGSILRLRPRLKLWRHERNELLPPVSLYSRSDKPRPVTRLAHTQPRGAPGAFVFVCLPFKTGPKGRFLNVSALRETGPLGCLALESLPPVFVRKPPPSRREALVDLDFFLGFVGLIL